LAMSRPKSMGAQREGHMLTVRHGGVENSQQKENSENNVND